MSKDNPLFIAFSKDGRQIYIDTMRTPAQPLQRLIPEVVENSLTTRIVCIKGDETILIDGDQLHEGDPEEDALFLEHIVRDEILDADYANIQRERIQTLPNKEII